MQLEKELLLEAQQLGLGARRLKLFALAEIAPKDMAVDGIAVYVAANPQYAGS